MLSLPNDQSKSSDTGLIMHLSQVRQAEITDHEVINSWSTGWMDRHFNDGTHCSVPNLTFTSYGKGTADDMQKDELPILDKNNGFPVNPPSFGPLTTYVSTLGLPAKESYFDTQEHADNSWLFSEATAAIFNLHADLSTFLEIWKPSVELVRSEVPQNTAAVAARKLKDVLPNQVAVSVTPPSMRLKSLQKNTVATDGKKEVVDKWYCVFCFNNARFAYEKCGIILHPKFNGPWRTHVCKDSKGVVICPILAASVSFLNS
uniref:Nanos-type domain-containing protein n=1 Tax=Loa loa TaxID=7209 RepID=A0A1I7VKY7_LOALO